jgi:site-specific recombinase XerD
LIDWNESLRAFDRDLGARSVAERTRRAYATDLGQFAEWSGEAAVEPTKVRHRDVRRYGAALSEAGAAPATVARKLAAIRSLYSFLVRTERAESNPADLVSSPKREQKLPKVLSVEQARMLLEQIPAHTPLELRDRAMLELAYSCGLRCEEIVNLDLGSLDFESERVRVMGKGSKERLLPVGEPAQRALRRYLESGRHVLGADRAEQALFLSKSGRRVSASGCARRRSPAASHRTASATVSPPICSKAAPICARFRSCSDTPRSRPRRSTRGSTRPAFGTLTRPLIHAHEPGTLLRT